MKKYYQLLLVSVLLGPTVFCGPRNFEANLGIFPMQWNFGISAKFCRSWNSPAISTIFDLMTHFYHRKNQTELPKAVGPTNSYQNMAQT